MHEEVTVAIDLAYPGRLVRDGKVVEGRDEWLFLANDQNDVIAQMRGDRTLSAEELDAWRTTIERRITKLAVPYLFLVSPDSHAIYPEKLPEGIAVSEHRPIHQLMSHLDTVPGARVVYFGDDLVRAKSRGEVCFPVDSHWSEFGAFIAYGRIMEEVGSWLPVRRLSSEDIAFQTLQLSGDLGAKIVPLRIAPHKIAHIRYPSSRLIFDNCVENIGSVLVTRCPDAPDATCLLFGDSFSYGLMKFLSESFRRVVFAHLPAVDFDLVRRENPDVVMSLVVERHLVGHPDDESYPPVQEHERAKRRDGRTRSPQHAWFSARWLSPFGIERLRDHLLTSGSRRDATIVSLLAYAGLRPREIIGLRWSDLCGDEIAIPRWSKGRRRIKARKVRLLSPLADDLEAWRKECSAPGPGRPVFPGTWGRGLWSDWREDVFEPALRSCGLDVQPPYTLCVMFGLLLCNEGATAKEIAKQLGHPLKWAERGFSGALKRQIFDPVPADRQIYQARSAVASAPGRPH
jgi:alginate O-acetyltransferase complex protein AlgJ